MTGAAGAGGGAAAVAAAIRRQQQEEEEMTPYDNQDLAQGWEFKILRSNTSTFRKPDALRRILEQERRAGWELVEKFDNGRVRLKRPVTARSRDESLDFDPYRTYVGMSGGMLAFAIVTAIIAGLVVAGFLVRAFRF